MQAKVDMKTVKERSKILQRLNIELSQKFQRQFLGQTAEILLENDNGQIYGRSERYFMVYLEKTSKKLRKNDLIKAKLVRYGKQGMCGYLP